MSCEIEYPCLSKHIESNDVYYIDLAPALGTSETVSSVTSITCSDSAMTAASATVLASDTTVTTVSRDDDGNTTTKTYVIAQSKGVSFTLSGGTVGSGCSWITAKYVKSTGKTDAVDVKVLVYGQDV